MGKGDIYNIVCTDWPFKTVSGDVTGFHRTRVNPFTAKYDNSLIIRLNHCQGAPFNYHGGGGVWSIFEHIFSDYIFVT